MSRALEADAKYVEQGIQVFQLDDYEWWAASDRDAAITAALGCWGGKIEDYFGEYSGVDGVAPCDLDANKINTHEDGAPEGPIIPFREEIANRIKSGCEFPCFFCGID